MAFIIISTKKAGRINLTPLPPSYGFSKNVFSRERVKPCIFVTFNNIISHVFPKYFTKSPPVV